MDANRLARSLPALLIVACAGSDPADKPSDEAPPDTGTSNVCAETADLALQTCLADYSAAAAACLEADGALCAAGDAGPAAALDALASAVTDACGDQGLFGLSVDATAARLTASCAAEADTLVWRTAGGPQAAVWTQVDSDAQTCLSATHAAGLSLIGDTLALISEGADLAGERQGLESAALASIEGACPDLAGLVAVDPATYVSRAARQADCVAATVHPDTTGLGLQCGPGYAAFDAPRGEWTQVQVDQETWGAVCGDGSPYAFWIHPAPEGSPLSNVMIGLQGGGVCVFEDDCTAKLASSPGLFTAQDDLPYSIAMVSDDPEESPFAEWTRVYLPYCNQDVFAGGGAVEELGDLSLPRAGGVNLRAALSMVRDHLWRELDAEGGAGYRPDEVVAFFGGWSAGSYGTLYNYHWLVDDLQWARTTGFPDAGLALDNGEPLGVYGLGLVKIPAWGTLPNLPPYCFAAECAVGPTLLDKLSPRLKQVPHQQMLLLSNPRDFTQQWDAYFSEEDHWINTMRQAHCDTRDLSGVHWYLTNVSDSSVHVVTIRPDLWHTAVDGQTMRDWFIEAVESPDTLQSRVQEWDFVDQVPGVEPFPCDVPE